MKFKEISEKFEEIYKSIDLTKKAIVKLNSSNSKSEIAEKFLKLETIIVSTQNSISSMPQPVSYPRCILAVLIALIAGILITTFGFALVGWVPIMETSDVPADMFAVEYNPYLYRVHIGDVAGTTLEYSNRFNQTFIGFVTDVNMTNRSETALITLKNREEEITLNEYWIQLIDEEWFECNYNVDLNRHPHHFSDYNGTYQLGVDPFKPISKDWTIIHTRNGKIRLERYEVDNTDRLYYYNSTYPGGAEVEYINNKFIIIYSQEEIEYERIL